MTLKATREHVFNKMPIRLLAFDNDGSNIRLIERNEIFSIILPGVLANIRMPEFQAEWKVAEMLKDGDLQEVKAWRHRQNRMKELIQHAIGQSVKYSILSHTWMRNEPGEITFHDWAFRENNLRGHTKIIKFCEVSALNHDTTLGWIDTVCINKTSSSELDESIRSMYNWYRRASVCVSYLSETTDLSNAHSDSWFTRGWTLQELLAPPHSVFYNQNWEQMGSNNDTRVQSVIEKACKISAKELDWSWQGFMEKIPLSRRLQMACSRQVTREEDTSYSLMGILDVDIPIAYGEGASHAFRRLIRELFNAKKNIMDLFNHSYSGGEGLFPSSLELYQYRSVFWDYKHNGGTYLDQYPPRDPIIPTHLGLRITLLLAPYLLTHVRADSGGDYVAKGSLSAVTTTTVFNEAGEMITGEEFHLLLCDRRLYAGDLTHHDLRSPAIPNGTAHITMAGIVNFGIDSNNNILLPIHAFALRLFWNGLERGYFIPQASEDVYTDAGQPISFRLESKIGYRIPKAALEEFGVQLVSMYL